LWRTSQRSIVVISKPLKRLLGYRRDRNLRRPVAACHSYLYLFKQIFHLVWSPYYNRILRGNCDQTSLSSIWPQKVSLSHQFLVVTKTEEQDFNPQQCRAGRIPPHNSFNNNYFPKTTITDTQDGEHGRWTSSGNTFAKKTVTFFLFCTYSSG